MSRTPVQNLSIGAGAALVVLALFGAAAFASVSRLARQQEDITDVNKAIASIDKLFAASAEAERAGTEYMMTGAEESLNMYRASRSSVEDAVDILRTRAEDRPRERSALDTLGPLIGQRFAKLDAGIATRKREGAAAATAFAKADADRTTRGGMVPLLQSMRDDELVILAEKTRLMSQREGTSKTVILAGSILALLLAAVALTPVKPSVAARLSRRMNTPIDMAAIRTPSSGIAVVGDSAPEPRRRAADRLTRLQELVHALDANRGANASADAVLKFGGVATPAVAAFVARYDGNGFVVMAQRDTSLSVGHQVPEHLLRPLADVIRLREPVVIENEAERDKRYLNLASVGTGKEVAYIGVPILSSGVTRGVYVLTFGDARGFDDDERAYLSTVGRLAGQYTQA